MRDREGQERARKGWKGPENIREGQGKLLMAREGWKGPGRVGECGNWSRGVTKGHSVLEGPGKVEKSQGVLESVVDGQ